MMVDFIGDFLGRSSKKISRFYLVKKMWLILVLYLYARSENDITNIDIKTMISATFKNNISDHN